ncbi:hypothetical protein M433DRAFT_159642 [Acidomyces richmondensis BFW]|nr:hypothetical protein M433DRAFT_159642 [Acidomyces richmondensis BFW]
MSHSYGTYTTTYSNYVGIHTLWPFVPKHGIDTEEFEILSLPFTLSSSGGEYTHSGPLSPATHSPVPNSYYTAVRTTLETAYTPQPTSGCSSALDCDLRYGGKPELDACLGKASRQWQLSGFRLWHIRARFNFIGVIAGLAIVAFITLTLLVRRRRARRCKISGQFEPEVNGNKISNHLASKQQRC